MKNLHWLGKVQKLGYKHTQSLLLETQTLTEWKLLCRHFENCTFRFGQFNVFMNTAFPYSLTRPAPTGGHITLCCCRSLQKLSHSNSFAAARTAQAMQNSAQEWKWLNFSKDCCGASVIKSVTNLLLLGKMVMRNARNEERTRTQRMSAEAHTRSKYPERSF